MVDVDFLTDPAARRREEDERTMQEFTKELEALQKKYGVRLVPAVQPTIRVEVVR